MHDAALYKIILFIAAIFTICSVSSIKKIIKEDARERKDNGRHYARIAQLQRHFYGRLFFYDLPLLERARTSATGSRLAIEPGSPFAFRFRQLPSIVTIIINISVMLSRTRREYVFCEFTLITAQLESYISCGIFALTYRARAISQRSAIETAAFQLFVYCYSRDKVVLLFSILLQKISIIIFSLSITVLRLHSEK